MGQKWLYLGRVVVIGQSIYIRAKWLFSGKNGCIRADVVFGQSGRIRANMVVFRISGCIPAKVVLFGQNLIYSDKVFKFVQKLL